MRYRYGRCGRWTPIVVIGALVGVQTVVCANPTVPGWIGSHGYGWALIVGTLIVLIEWPALRYITGFSWGGSLALAAGTNFGSALLGIGIDAAVGVLLEPLIIAIFAAARSYRRWHVAFLLALILNEVTGVGTAGLRSVIPPTNTGGPSACTSNLKQIGVAMRTYAEAHGGMFPPARTTDEFLRAVVGPSLDESDEPTPLDGLPRWAQCPGERTSRWALVAPRAPEGGGYALVGIAPDALVGAAEANTEELLPGTLYLPPELAYERVLLADDGRRHGFGRMCLYHDGHVKYVRGDEALSMGATRDDFVEAPQYAAGDESDAEQ